jgi:hypothetical protein
VSQYIAPSLIVLRIALGKAYTQSTGSYVFHSTPTGGAVRVNLAVDDGPRGSAPTIPISGSRVYGDLEMGEEGVPYEKSQERFSPQKMGTYGMESVGRK